MARVRVRPNIYAAMPFLAFLIMAVGCVFTMRRIMEYRDPNMKYNVELPRYTEEEEEAPKAPTPPEAGPVTPAAPEAAPKGDKEAAPTEGPEAAPAEGAPAEKGAKEAAPPAEKGEVAPPADKGEAAPPAEKGEKAPAPPAKKTGKAALDQEEEEK
jgi:type IV secretory pathway VirB10-like protein